MDMIATATTEVTGTPWRRPLTHPEEIDAMLAEYPVAVICDCTGVLEAATPMLRSTVMDAPGVMPRARFLDGCHEVFQCPRCGGHELFPPAGSAAFVRESWPEWGSRTPGFWGVKP